MWREVYKEDIKLFGYINVNKNDMSYEDISTYKSFYCGVCRALKGIGGNKTTMYLNYDVVFLGLVLSGLYEPEENSFEFTCPVHPAKKRTAFKNDILDYSAKMDIILSYQSLMDDFHDENDRTKKAFADSIKKYYDEIALEFPRQVKAIELFMEKTLRAEENNETNLDILSGYTGEMLSSVFLYKEDEWRDDLSDLGFYLGKYIYILDCYVDFEKDIKKKNFNPLIFISAADEDYFETFVKQNLTSNISECAKAFERLPILKYASIIRNILYSGIWSHYEIAKKRHMKNGSI